MMREIIVREVLYRAKSQASMCMRTLRKPYAEFMQPLTQVDIVQVDECVVYADIDMVRYHPGWAAPLMFASNLLKGMINFSHRILGINLHLNG